MLITTAAMIMRSMGIFSRQFLGVSHFENNRSRSELQRYASLSCRLAVHTGLTERIVCRYVET